MQRSFYLPTLLALAIFSGLPRMVRAAGEEEVRFDSADGVEIKGTFYPTGKGKSPCVILLHAFTKNRQQEGLGDLAKALQAKDFAVLTFDFRGHNDSTKVGDDFWKQPANRVNVASGKNANKISYKDFKKPYFPMLVNDVAAAKRYVDTRSDSGDCNASNVIVIGIEDGASIGAAWIAQESVRYRLVKNPQFPVFLPQWIPDPNKKVEGEDIAAAVWINLASTRFTTTAMGGWLKSPSVRDKVPMAFIYGEKNEAAAKTSKDIYKEMKPKDKEFELTATRSVKGAKTDLLGKELGTEKEICTYLEKVMDKRGNVAPFKREPMNGPPFMLLSLKPIGFNLP